MHPHLPLKLILKVAWTPKPQWGGGRDVSWSHLPVPEVDPGCGLALMVASLAVVVIPGGGASDYMYHVPLRVCLSCIPLHAIIGAVASGGNLVGGVPAVAGHCTPNGIGMGGKGMW